MEAEWQQGSGSEEDLDSEEEETTDENCPIEPSCHPRLDGDIETVRRLYSHSSLTIGEYQSIDKVDVDLNIDGDILDEEVAKAWRVNPSEPIVFRLHFSLSQYLNGPEPTVEVFQSSNRHFGLGRQLESVLAVFISQEWNHLTNENVIVRQKRRHSWFSPGGTMKKFRARLSIWLPLSKSNTLQDRSLRGRIVLPARKRNHFANHATSYKIKNPSGELFTYRPRGKSVVVSGVKSSAQLSTKRLMELLFLSQAIGHCKTAPTLQHGFLAQVMRYAEQRIPTLNEYCVVCDERHVFQNGPLLKPAVCSRELCVFSFHMSGATEAAATGAEVVDLLVAMCRAAVQSSRKSVIFEPYPSVVDPKNPKTLAFSPKRKSYERLEKALDSVLLIRRMTQGSYSEIKKQMDTIDPLAIPLLQCNCPLCTHHTSSCSSAALRPKRLVFKLHANSMAAPLLSSEKMGFILVRIRNILPDSPTHNTFFFFASGSHVENWHSILRNGLVNASNTKFQIHGAAYGKGIYLSPISSISFGYSDMGKGQHQMPTKEELLKNYNRVHIIQQDLPGRFLQSRNLNCVALCEVITSKELKKHGNIWVCPVSDHVCTRFLFVYENGCVGDVHINTQEEEILSQVLEVIATKPG
ncbi:protein mono-ADP-ribosyltransferase PARP6-like isoform X1 [Phycodurus eques]|uniref:protein mono-ADP-ribosyltransferase PARP6-like isoform X1 n=1 Tax=Phycodurus eques TaxID=693459 RepID=UPI002ACE4C89|nr:protein mono-ADP-ribosyltransferase PARP6-like isoform X1 [Phycodurus eques]XP_061532139.1 protein mono-ADP-ribosyltransferase PARP6-like isoform X1 [Phycodurus eques]